MKVAIFADIHGKILLPFRLVDLYQNETGSKVDFILQCGDIGAFPDIHNLDKATKRYSTQSRDELGFHDDFVKPDEKIRSYLNELDVDMICVRGNHEDHDFLDNLEKKSPEPMFPIDAYKRVFVCKTGIKQQLKCRNDLISFVGIGRIGYAKESNEKDEKQFIQEYEKLKIKKLLKTKESFDLLLTHDNHGSSIRGCGMSEIREVLDKVVFEYHFYGHTGEDFKQERYSNGATQSIKIKELEFSKSGILAKGCMIILNKEDGKLSFEVVDQKLTNRMTKYNWKL